jgi:hypothetical protein
MARIAFKLSDDTDPPATQAQGLEPRPTAERRFRGPPRSHIAPTYRDREHTGLLPRWHRTAAFNSFSRAAKPRACSAWSLRPNQGPARWGQMPDPKIIRREHSHDVKTAKSGSCTYGEVRLPYLAVHMTSATSQPCANPIQCHK